MLTSSAAGMHERHQYALLEALSPLGQRQRRVGGALRARVSNRERHHARGDRQLALADLDYDY
jgi:hypothetical protein